MKLQNKVYDALKFLSLIIVPVSVCIAAIITAVTSGGSVPSIVLAIGEALAALLGTILVVASKIYWQNQSGQNTPDLPF